MNITLLKVCFHGKLFNIEVKFQVLSSVSQGWNQLLKKLF